jgi:hypothetical protein
MLATLLVLGDASASLAADPCGPTGNKVACENSKPGTPRDVWDMGQTAGDDSIQGFATAISVAPGGTIGFKIDTDASSYAITIYRTGWYGGDGARQIATVAPFAHLPQTQPSCIYDATTQLTDCGNWALSASWTVPTTAVSGVYVADLYRADKDDMSQITFVVTDPTSTSAILLKTSDATWEAYNTYGGADFYQGGDPGRSYAVSYNRPFLTRGHSGGRDFYFSAEYPLVEFLERNGYDVSYTTDLDTALGTAANIEQHKVFISSGHDEYWFNQERKNVEAARDAGVNMQFLSGNEVYWDTRPTPSIDGSNTPYRTITSYKETWSNAKVDPSTQWTGTWRDPRFSSQANGGSYPEEALTGTQYMSNFTDLPISVTKAQGAYKLWANSGLSTMTGSSTALAPHTIGYESDEDVDNGFRQSGLLYLSTTTGAVDQYLQDYGNVVEPGTTTHHMTLYRAASGALVMSAGSVGWSWGLDQNHDGNGAAADPRMEQFEINMLAFMGVQPATLDSTLKAGAGRTDTTPPTVTITSPAPGSSVANGTQVTLMGTASDVGGVVAAIEISVDGGTTWHMANGTTSWSYGYVQHGIGTQSVLVRAVDDSANYAASPATFSYNVTGPYSILGNATPAVPDSGDTSAVELGLRFTAAQDGFITGVRFYKSAANSGVHTGSLWDANGNRLATVTFSGETASGWQAASFSSAVSVTSGQSYIVSYSTTTGHYAADSTVWDYRGSAYGPMTVAGGYGALPGGVYGAVGKFPASSFGNTEYFVDATFSDTDTSPLTAGSQWPVPGASSVPLSTPITAVMSRAISASSLHMSVVDANGAAVAGQVSYDASTRTATFTPAAALSGFVNYTVTVSATSATGGYPLSAGGSWSFTTVKPTPSPGVCPCSLYADSAVPVELQDADAKAVTLGVKFSASQDGQISAVSFYKAPGNTGSHMGALWSTSGALLASGTFTNESSTGWQTLTFATPVDVTAGTVYVASYRTTVGAYSVTPSGFSGGLTVGPLTATSGMYSYADQYPNSSSSASYLVDVTFSPSAPRLSVVGDTPGDGAVGVPLNSTISLTTSRPLASGYTVSVTSGGAPIAGTAHLSADGTVASFVPSASLPANKTVQVTFGNLNGAGGGTLPNQSWSFTTADPNAPVPDTLFGNLTPAVAANSSDASPVEVGTAFTTDVAGTVTGIRFYKATTNTGTHVGHLWTSDGVLLASVTFTAESASGWQSALLSAPVTLTPDTRYVVSYYAPNGNYSSTSSFFGSDYVSIPLTAPRSGNGLYLYGTGGGMPVYSWNNSNYFVDVTFQPTGSTQPTDPPTSDPSPVPPESIFADSSSPATENYTDKNAAQLGVRFTTATNGTITGVRYWRSSGDTSDDAIYLWTATGTKLASATAPYQGTSGWVYAPFAVPVSVSAGTEYRASYYSPGKHYAYTTDGLKSAVTAGDLTALGSAYVYGSSAPANTSKTNYWVDVRFVPGS